MTKKNKNKVTTDVRVGDIIRLNLHMQRKREKYNDKNLLNCINEMCYDEIDYIFNINSEHRLVCINSPILNDIYIYALEKMLDSMSVKYITLSERITNYSHTLLLEGLKQSEDKVLIVNITEIPKIKRKELDRLRKDTSDMDAIIIFVTDEEKEWVRPDLFDTFINGASNYHN